MSAPALGYHPPPERQQVSFSRSNSRTVVARDPLQPEKCAKLLAALAAPERLRIVRLLTAGPLSVTAIADGAGVKPLNIAHHLTMLKGAGLIRGRRHGRSVLYSLSPGVLEEVVEAGISHNALNLGCCRLALPAEGERDSGDTAPRA